MVGVRVMYRTKVAYLIMSHGIEIILRMPIESCTSQNNAV